MFFKVLKSGYLDTISVKLVFEIGHNIVCRSFQVLMPLPGHRIEYPHNEIKEWYTELLEADGLSVSGLNHRVR